MTLNPSPWTGSMSESSSSIVFHIYSASTIMAILLVFKYTKVISNWGFLQFPLSLLECSPLSNFKQFHSAWIPLPNVLSSPFRIVPHFPKHSLVHGEVLVLCVLIHILKFEIIACIHLFTYYLLVKSSLLTVLCLYIQSCKTVRYSNFNIHVQNEGIHPLIKPYFIHKYM